MSRLKTAFTTLKAIAASAIDSPRSTLDAIKYLPTVARGLHFSRTAQLPPPPAASLSAGFKSVSQYPFVTVIEKHEHHPGLFISQKKETQWQT